MPFRCASPGGHGRLTYPVWTPPRVSPRPRRGWMTAVHEREAAPPRRRRVPRAVRELIYIVAFWLVYTVGSLLVEGRVDTAFHNAHLVWQFERAVHLPHEASIQAALTAYPWLIRPANFFYANVHF